MTGLGVRPAALPAWQRLQAALAQLDGPTPCRADPDAWADPSDAEVAEMAEHLCQRCPVIELCGIFADANKENAGVWAGRNRQPKPGRPAVQSKEETA